MKNIQYDNSDESNSDFDSGPEEPNLYTLPGYDCYFTCKITFVVPQDNETHSRGGGY